MALLGKSKDSPSERQPLLREGDGDGGEAGPSGIAPPSFEESAGHLIVTFNDTVDTFPEGGEEPPEFTPYEAEHWVSWGGDIISHDAHLNEDGEALYRFLLSQAETPPTFVVHCLGTHDETRSRQVDRIDSQGRRNTDVEWYTETVTDFDFQIEYRVPTRATQWTVGDEESAYRGRMYRETGPPGGTIKASRSTTKRFDAWASERSNRGLPPWVGPENRRAEEPASLVKDVAKSWFFERSMRRLLPWVTVVEAPVTFVTEVEQPPSTADVLKSSWTLRQWADDYCQSRKIFKEFVYEKVVYSWDLNTLETAIRAAIRSTDYNGDRVEVKFESGHRTVIVRPNTRISRAISNPWLKILLIITLIYPCIWLFKRFHRRGGGRWAVGGGAYALKRTVDGVPGSNRRVVMGEGEGEWFRRWEETIRSSVMERKVDQIAMTG